VRLDDGWMIRDLGSLNGTRVNGWLVQEQRLRDGDTLTFGGSVFLFDAH
jgi:pSer/pThr/pTyr-binding forkhead associated (FHA) protein